MLSQHSRGFGLVEVIIMVAIVGTLLAGIITVLVALDRNIRRTEAIDRGNALFKEIRLLWQEASLCAGTFGGLRLNRNLTETDPQVVEMLNRRLNNTRFTSYHPRHPFRLARVVFVANEPLATGQLRRVRGKMLMEARSGSITMGPRDFNLLVEIDSSDTIVKCEVERPGLQPGVHIVETGVTTDTFIYPAAKLSLPWYDSSRYHSQRVTAACPVGYTVLDCLGGFAPPGASSCTPEYKAYDSDASGDPWIDFDKNLHFNISSRAWSLNHLDSRTCAAVINGNFGYANNINDPYYRKTQNSLFCVKARCVK